MMLESLDDQQFATSLPRDGLALVTFEAPWCSACRGFKPELEAACRRFPNAHVLRVNSDAAPLLRTLWKVAHLPSLFAVGMRDGNCVGRSPVQRPDLATILALSARGN